MNIIFYLLRFPKCYSSSTKKTEEKPKIKVLSGFEKALGTDRYLCSIPVACVLCGKRSKQFTPYNSDAYQYYQEELKIYKNAKIIYVKVICKNCKYTK